MGFYCCRYESGERLSPEHERTILERLLPYHPECEKKIGSGVDYITVLSLSLLCTYACTSVGNITKFLFIISFIS